MHDPKETSLEKVKKIEKVISYCLGDLPNENI